MENKDVPQNYPECKVQKPCSPTPVQHELFTNLVPRLSQTNIGVTVTDKL